jgi:hypothetical protein
MNSGGGLITLANLRLADAAFRDQLRTMHANQTPLIEMVNALGLSGEMSGAVRTIVEQLPPDVVEEIRQATLAMLDTKTLVMPVDCNLTEEAIDDGAPVNVSVVDEKSRPTIVVRAR